MNYLKKISLPLNEKETSRLYWELKKIGGFCSGEKYSWKYEKLSQEKLLVLAILQSRYEPQLMAILVDFFCKSSVLWNPLSFKTLLKQTEALHIAAVIGQMLMELPASEETKDFFRFLMVGVKPISTQLFYRGIYPLGSKKMEEVVSRPLWAFKKWGFLAANPPLLKETILHKRTYLFDQKSRLHILRELFREKKQIRLKDYLQATQVSISRQQALKDIRSVSWIKKRGERKGTVYFKA